MRDGKASTSSTTVRRAIRLRAVVLLLAGASLLPAACVTVSEQDEIAIGRDFSRQINQQLPLIEEPLIRGPVADLGHELARLSARPDLPYEFQVVNTDVINAFAVPGGFIYMNRGLIAESRNMAEVAGVMAHEVNHVVARHSAEQIERAQNANLLVGLGSILLGAPGPLASLGVNVVGNLYFAQYSRSQESEADSLAVGLLVEAGWDPRGLVTFFQTMMEARDTRPGALEALFASHPLTEDRIDNVRRMISRIPPERLETLRLDSPAYGNLKAALVEYPPPPEGFRASERVPDDEKDDEEEDGGEDGGA